MVERKFSKKEALRFGWQIMRQNLIFFIPLLIVVGLITTAPDLINVIKELPFYLYLIISIVSIVLGLIVELGLIKISLNFCDNFKSKIRDIFSQYRLFFRYLFASILYGLIVLFGLVLLIIPGIYLSIRLQFYGYFIVDKKSKIIESLKRSWAITQGNVWNLFVFGLLLGLINLLGVLVLIVGLFATIPTTMVAIAFVYRKLLTQSETPEETKTE